MKRRGRVTLIELMVIGVIFCILSTILLTACPKLAGITGGIGKDYSNGVRAGHLMKVSRKGLFYSSYEAELQVVDNIAITNSTDNSVNTPKVFWQVSTKNEKLGKQLEDLVGKKVKIKYTQYLVKPIEFDSSYEILSYEEVK